MIDCTLFRRRVLAVGLIVAVAGCAAGGESADTPSETLSSAPTHYEGTRTRTDGAAPSEPQKLLPGRPGLHNVLRVAEGIYSGSEPEGDDGFASLAQLGIKVIVSVDGAVPHLDAARKHRMRYVHLPIGYDGVPFAAGLALARLTREPCGPIYLHCHHGQHRGPAAAAVACVAAGKMSPRQALTILEMAETSKDYPGLWRDVAAYSPPAVDAVLPELVECAAVDSLTAAMAQIDRCIDELKLCRDADWSSPPAHPDLVPAQAALLVREALHEALRTAPPERFDSRFRDWLSGAERHAERIEAALRESQQAAASVEMKALEASCRQCHATYRN